MKASRLGPHSRFLSFLSEAAKLFGIAIACLLAMGAAVFVSIKTGIVVPVRWFGLFCWTCFLLWFVFRQHKRDLRQLRFWLAVSGFLIVHVFAFFVVLRAYPTWPMIWFMLIVVIEGPLVLVALQNIIHPPGTRRGA